MVDDLAIVVGAAVVVGAVALYRWRQDKAAMEAAAAAAAARQKEEDERPPPRDFTPAQLAKFTGEEKTREGEPGPVYMAVKGRVFDVSRGREFYGPGGPYAMFAGKDASRALAKMSFEPADVNNPDISDLTFVEREELTNWEQKFEHWKGYPVVGRVLEPAAPRDFTAAELRTFNGEDGSRVYIALRGNVYDVSFGGAEHYGPGGGYHMFAGRDASLALAKMSFEPELLENPALDGLTERENEVLDDWIKKYEEKNGYPVVGRLV